MRKPFAETTGLIYDKKEGTVAFEGNNEKLIFKMPHNMEMFKNVDFMGISTGKIPPFIIGGNDDDNEKTHYSDSLNLGPEYKYHESVCKAIRSLIRMKNMRKNRGEFTLVPSCFAIFTFEPLTLSLTSMPSCDLVSLTNILILCLILKALNQSLRKTLSLNLEL
ncbi:hypothetical protein Tco_1050336 [Tanacetum coccineum]